MSDSRRNTRKPVPLFVGDATDVRTDAAQFLGRTRDLSMAGLFLITNQRPEVGARRRLVVVWGEEAQTTWARVVRHGDDGVALVFEEPTAEFTQAIAEAVGKVPPATIKASLGGPDSGGPST